MDFLFRNLILMFGALIMILIYVYAGERQGLIIEIGLIGSGVTVYLMDISNKL